MWQENAVSTRRERKEGGGKKDELSINEVKKGLGANPAVGPEIGRDEGMAQCISGKDP